MSLKKLICLLLIANFQLLNSCNYLTPIKTGVSSSQSRAVNLSFSPDGNFAALVNNLVASGSAFSMDITGTTFGPLATPTFSPASAANAGAFSQDSVIYVTANSTTNNLSVFKVTNTAFSFQNNVAASNTIQLNSLAFFPNNNQFLIVGGSPGGGYT